MCVSSRPEPWEAGPKAQSAREALKAAANDPAMRHEAEWALNRIAGSHLVIGANERQRGSLASERGGGPARARQSGSPRGEAPRLRKRAILQLTGIRPPAGTSSGVSSWETRRSVVPWLLAMRSMSAPTTQDA